MTHQVDHGDYESPQETIDILPVHAVEPSVPKSYKVPVEVNGVLITMEIDTGAGVSLVSEQTWPDKLRKPQLQRTDLPLEGYIPKPTSQGSWKMSGPSEDQQKRGSTSPCCCRRGWDFSVR